MLDTILNKIIEEINKANRIALLVHVNPDGDALGSGLTMYIILKQLKKNVDLIIPSYPRIYDFLPHTSDIKENTNIKSYDLCICLDCASKERIFEPINNKIFDNAKKTIVIDHHSSNTLYGDLNYVVSEEPACSQILIKIIDKMNIRLTKKMGECLIAGIITDTGGYKNSNINSSTFLISSRLMDLDIDIHKVIKKLIDTKTMAQFELMKLVVNRMELLLDNKVAFSYITFDDMKEAGAFTGDHEGLVDIGRSIENVLVSVFIREDIDGYNISLRSNNDINVRDIAKSFNGGGHKVAAGCVINDTLDNAKKLILKRIEKEING